MKKFIVKSICTVIVILLSMALSLLFTGTIDNFDKFAIGIILFEICEIIQNKITNKP